MIFRTAVRDCLYLNWAVPVAALPPLEPPLRYDARRVDDERYVFVSAALFRLQGLHLKSVPLLRLSHPQFLLRQAIFDADGLPAFYLQTVLVPSWAVPAARLVARQPARGGWFDYPLAGEPLEPGHWEVRRRRRLVLDASPGSPAAVGEPDLGSWKQTVAYFQHRRRGYFHGPRGLQRLEFAPRELEPVPLSVELADDSLLEECLPLAGGVAWPRLHSAWLCSEESFLFELGSVPEASLPSGVPAPG